jgi:gluconolactonase
MARIVCSDFTFSEGPVWLSSAGRLLFSDFAFQDAANDFPGNVMQYEPGGDCSIFASDVGANGLAIALDGSVLAARNPTQAIASIDVGTQMVTDIVTDYMAQAFSSPNDLTVRSDGTIYFSDPAWQLGNRTQELDHAVYRVDPEGNVSLAQDLADRRPNGVTLSPDETKLYVSVVEPDQILVFDVASDGGISNQQIFVDAGSDGMAIDCAGNLYATSGVVHVYSPEGDDIGSITLEGSAGGLPDPTNLAFGGANRTTLYVTGASYLRSVELQIPGYPF